MSPPSTPESRARAVIDARLAQAGWVVQDRSELNLSAGEGVAVREVPLAAGHGQVDYLLFVERKAVGVLEAKPEGHTLTGVERQAAVYAEGLPPGLRAAVSPLPFQYLSTGALTRFTNLLDPEPRSRELFQFHRPATLAEWLKAEPLETLTRPSTLRSRLHGMPPAATEGLWLNQVEALGHLEESLKGNRPRSLIQMATGSGKTLLAVASIYRLVKFAGARRVLFLVDRGNLGEQAEKEFWAYHTPDDRRRFTELYNVQRLQSNTVTAASKVVITTIQRLYSMLKGEPELELAAEEGSLFDRPGLAEAEPLPVTYNAALPPEFFDVIFVDECHRSIYSLWRQVLEYFDAFLIGLTATPARHTYGFFNQNVVSEYSYEDAVADGVNVDHEIYRIRTKISRDGSTIEASPLPILGHRSRQSRRVRWTRLDEDLSYEASALDRAVVAKDQIRLIVRTFRDRLFTEIFPGRREVPKTLVFAKDDSHAEDIVELMREEFGRGNDFCQKITYKSTGRKPSDLIQDFRTSFYPRIAVTVDMIATGTDVKPIEIVMFLRSVKSRVLFEQMRGRGVRTIDTNDLRQATPDAPAKTHFVLIDCVGLAETELADSQPLERKRGVSLATLLELVAFGSEEEEVYSSLASRLARLERRLGEPERARFEEATEGESLSRVVRALVHALDPDLQLATARRAAGLPPDAEPTPEQVEKARVQLLHEAAAPLATRPKARRVLLEIKQELEQILDEVSSDELLEAGASPEAREKAREMVRSFERFLAEHREELAALQFFYSVPHRQGLRFGEVKALAAAIGAPPRSWTPERLWRAYELLEKDRVRGASAGRLLTDVVSLVKFALGQAEELVPFGEEVRRRFVVWMAQQETAGRRFTAAQRQWLEMMRDHIATSVAVEAEDFEYTPFVEEGGLGRARQVFGEELGAVMQELNEVLAA